MANYHYMRALLTVNEDFIPFFEEFIGTAPHNSTFWQKLGERYPYPWLRELLTAEYHYAFNDPMHAYVQFGRETKQLQLGFIHKDFAALEWMVLGFLVEVSDTMLKLEKKSDTACDDWTPWFV